MAIYKQLYVASPIHQQMYCFELQITSAMVPNVHLNVLVMFFVARNPSEPEGRWC